MKNTIFGLCVIVFLSGGCGRDRSDTGDASVQDGGDAEVSIPTCEEIAAAPAMDFQSAQVPADCVTATNCYQTALVSSGDHLYFYEFQVAQLFRSETGLSDWDDLGSVTVGSAMNSEKADVTSSAVFVSSIGAQGGIFVVHENSDNDERRFAVYDVENQAWALREEVLSTTHALVALGQYIFGFWHAGGGAPLRRYQISGGEEEQGATLGNVQGADPAWFSRAAQMATLDGGLYGSKNDEDTIDPEVTNDTAGDGDRLYRITHESFENGMETPATDLAQLPFEVGQGSLMVALPAGWDGRVSTEGALLIIAGRSPSDHDGYGDASDAYTIYDLACESFRTGTLPEVSGAGASATLHNGTLFIKRGGDPGDPYNKTLWYVQ